MMNILKYLLALCLGFPPLVVAADLSGDRTEATQQESSGCCADVPAPLVIYQPADAMLRNYAPYQKRISALLDYLAAHPAVGLRLEGNTDSRKSSEYSFGLAQRYADSVKKYLVSQGVDSVRIIAVSMGKEKPAVAGKNLKVWAKNRRVEIKLYPIKAHHGSSDADLTGAR